MRIEELEELLSKHPFLPKPKYVFMIEERVIAELNGYSFVRGATPKWRGDVIILTPDARHDTVVHEVIHTLGFGELVANLLSPRIAKLRELIPPIISSNVKYSFSHSPHPKVKVYVKIE